MVVGPLVVGAMLIGASYLLVVWTGRRSRRRLSRIAGRGLGFGVMAVAVVGVGVYTWALLATDSSQLARAIVWGDSSFGDQDIFPSRAMGASTNPVEFRHVDDPLVAGFPVDGHQGPLAHVLESTDTTAFIVIHGDELMYEGYFNGSSRDSIQTSFSVAKSFLATLVGIAIEEGDIGSLDDPVTDYVPELAARDQEFDHITLRHLITMSSGLTFQDGASPWDDPSNTYYGTDLRAAVMAIPAVEGPPGVTFHYNDWNVILLGLVLERATATPVTEFMESRLWQAMGSEADGSWSLDSEGSGFEKMFVGVNGRAIDFAKLGWLYLHEGRNGDDVVVPAGFVAEATRLDTTTDPAAQYQYLWWIDVDGRAYFANGDHGQFIYVSPPTRLVIVRHGTSPGDLDWIQFFRDLVDWLEPRLQDGEATSRDSKART